MIPKNSNASVANLRIVRSQLLAPTALAAGTLGELRRIAPGFAECVSANGEMIQVHVRRLNPFVLEQEAYRAEGKPIPPRVMQDANQWRKENGY